MADIVIRGMKMPRGCFECPFDRFGDVRDRVTSCYLKTEQGEKCPLVELSKGHGRCIDADALIDEFTRSAKAGQLNPWSIVKNAHTIVPAEGAK